MVNNMPGIQAINQPKITNVRTPEQRKENQEKVAAGAGGAAGATGATAKAIGRRAAKIEEKEKTLQHMMSNVNRTSRTMLNNSEKVEGLFATFKSNIKRYTDDIITRLSKLQESKFIGPIVKSPVTKKVAGVFGGALAFFVLVTGVNKACRTGAIAIDDFKRQYHDING